ncbi:MAG: type II secretion system F family protein [Candidatus Aminicenantia bacterium]
MTLLLILLIVIGYIVFLSILFRRPKKGKTGKKGDAEWIHENLSFINIEIPLEKCRKILLISTFAPPAFILLVGLIFLKWWQTLILAFLFYFIGKKAPKIYVKRRLKKRIEKLEDQLLDTLTMLSGALKAGLSLPQAFETVLEDMTSPMKEEIEQILNLNRLGQPIEEALERLAQRVPTENVEILVTSVITLSETGGNLAEAFDSIVNTINERERVREKIKSMTALGEYQGLIASLSPIVFIGLLYFMNPEIAMSLLNTIPGWIILGIALTLDILGYFLMKKIATIKV